MTPTTYDVVVIGAGLTGLTTTLLLKQKGLNVLLVEKAPRVGGAMQTIRANGYVYESGPSTATLSNIETVKLFDMLGSSCRLEVASPAAASRLILKNNVPQPLPCTLVGGIRTPLFRLADKLRLLTEPWRSKGTDPNETVASLVRRRLGSSFLDYAVQPFIGGIYAGNPECLVTRHALPKLYNLEQEYGSFMRGALAKHRLPKTEEERRVTKQVFSVRGGFGSLINALAYHIGTEHIRLNQTLCTVHPGPGLHTVHLNAGMVQARTVVSTVGAHAVGGVFPDMPDGLRTQIESLRYARVVQVAIGLKPAAGLNPRSFGLLIPACENRRLLGILFPSACFEGRAPQHHTLLSAFLGGMARPEMTDKTDDELRAIVLDELHTIYRIKPHDVDFLHIFRHPHAIPQYEATCTNVLSAVQAFQQMHPGIILAGNLRDGIGIPNRIKQGLVLSL